MDIFKPFSQNLIVQCPYAELSTAFTAHNSNMIRCTTNQEPLTVDAFRRFNALSDPTFRIQDSHHSGS